MTSLRLTPLMAALCGIWLLLLGGCANPAGNSGLTLGGQPWRLVALGGKPVEVQERAPSLQFDLAAGRAAGFAGVNRYSGDITLDGARLTFGPAILTKMAGPPERMELERRFTAALAATTSWRIRERQLELLAGDNYVLAAFVVGPAD